MTASARRPTTLRSSSRRTGSPSNDQECSCATTTGVREARAISAPHRLEPNLCVWTTLMSFSRSSRRRRDPRPEVGRLRAAEVDDAHAVGLQRLRGLEHPGLGERVAIEARDAHPGLETVPIQACGELRRETFRAADGTDQVDEREHARRWRHGGHARNSSSMAEPLVLCYHALSPDWPAILSTTQERFAEQLRHLAGRGYRGVTFSEAAAGRAAGKTVAVTFDDAYRSVGGARQAGPRRARLAGDGLRPDRLPGPRRADGLGGHRQLARRPARGRADPARLGRAARAARRGLGDRIAHVLASPPDRAGRRGAGARAGRVARGLRARAGGVPLDRLPVRRRRRARRRGHARRGLRDRGRAARAAPRSAPARVPRAGVYHADDLRRFRTKVSPLVRRLRRALRR